MIYTLTTNPAVDISVTIEKLREGSVNRTLREKCSPHGKGVNVALTLHHFHEKVGVLGFFGGFSGAYIVDSVRERGLCCHPVFVDGITRMNYFVGTSDGEDYKFVANGCPVPREKQLEMLRLLEDLEDLHLLVVSGSLSPEIDVHFYDELIALCKQKNAPIVFDISSGYLKNLLPGKPLLIKPNDEELKEIFGLDCSTPEETVQSMKQLHEMGAQNILLTRGKDGMYFSNGKKLYKCSAYPIAFVNSTCAGDGTLGAFLSIWYSHPDRVVEALQLAAAAGADVAGSLGLGDFSRVESIKDKIHVEEIDLRQP